MNKQTEEWILLENKLIKAERDLRMQWFICAGRQLRELDVKIKLDESALKADARYRSAQEEMNAFIKKASKDRKKE